MTEVSQVKLTPLNRKDVGTFLIWGIISYTIKIITVFYINKNVVRLDVACDCL